MIRWLALFLLPPLLLLGRPSAARTVEGTILSGGDLPHAVRLAPVDEDAFFRRIDLPPRLDQAPRPAGPAYTLASSYWDTVLRDDGGGGPPADAEALYYPDGGFVRARQAGADVWLLLEERQRAILDRYIRLARAGLLSAEPGVLQVLAAAAGRGELISVQAGGTMLTEAQTRAFWDAVAAGPAPAFLSDQKPPGVATGGFWLVFTLPEGRAVQLLYSPAPDSSLIDSLGGERYAVTPLLHAAIRAVGASPTLEIEQQEPRGSDLWWPVMLGAGLALLGAAWWLRRRKDR